MADCMPRQDRIKRRRPGGVFLGGPGSFRVAMPAAVLSREALHQGPRLPGARLDRQPRGQPRWHGGLLSVQGDDEAVRPLSSPCVNGSRLGIPGILSISPGSCSPSLGETSGRRWGRSPTGTGTTAGSWRWRRDGRTRTRGGCGSSTLRWGILRMLWGGLGREYLNERILGPLRGISQKGG
jgi:hypothetical protein